jgi:type IX secretion system PorP/SprF family membrane protein
MRRYSCAIGIFAFVTAFGQQSPRYGMHHLTAGYTNPAALCIESPISISLLHHFQWFGLEGSPLTHSFSANWESDDQSAIGLLITDDRIGVHVSSGFRFQYAYRLHIDRDKYVSFGVGCGLDNRRATFTELQTTIGYDPAFAANSSNWRLNAQTGIFFRSASFYAGLALPSMLTVVPNGQQQGFNPGFWDVAFLGGYKFKLAENWIIEPCAQLTYNRYSPFHASGYVRFGQNYFAVHSGISSDAEAIFGFDLTINKRFRFAYQGRISYGNLSPVKGFSHELMMSLGLPDFSEGVRFDKRKYINRRNKWKLS